MPTQNAIWAYRRLDITEMMTEGIWVWALMSYTGLQIGEWMGLPPTGETSTHTRVGL